MKSVNRVSPQIEQSENNFPMGTGSGFRQHYHLRLNELQTLFSRVSDPEFLPKKPLNDFGGASNEEEETFLTQASQRSATFVLDGKL